MPRIRRKMYMGHAVADVTELYECHEVEAYLSADATRLREWVELPEPSQTLKRAKSE